MKDRAFESGPTDVRCQRLSASAMEYLACVAEAEGVDPRAIEAARLRHSGLTLAEIGARLPRAKGGGVGVAGERVRSLIERFWRGVRGASDSYVWGRGPLPSPCHRVVGALRDIRTQSDTCAASGGKETT